jgi:hypothetical protein
VLESPVKALLPAVLSCLWLLFASSARAAGIDFLDEILIARGLGGQEVGVELRSDSRIDRDYRLQGWFSPELEVGLTKGWLIEGGTSFIHRGRGLEFGALHGESRVVLLDADHAPLGLALAGEYEVEAPAAKHLVYERLGGLRAVVTRRFASALLLTANAGVDRRFVPVRADGEMYALGVRYPDGAAIAYGFGWRRQTLERVSRLGPELRFRLPNRMNLIVGSTFALNSSVYRYVGRAVLEADL